MTLLEREIERMLLTKRDDPKKLLKLVKGKPWKGLLELCMKIEKSVQPRPNKDRIVWVRLKIRASFLDSQKAANLERLKKELEEMAKDEGLKTHD